MRHTKKNSGFTLVEVVVSLLIILAAVSGIFASFVASQKYVKRAKGRTNVSNAARQQLEQLNPFVRSNIWTQETYNGTANKLYAPVGSTRAYTAGSIPKLKDSLLTYSVASSADTAATSYRVVTLTASWKE